MTAAFLQLVYRSDFNSGYTYDASGDLTSDGVHTYQYDAEGRLISVDNGSTATYIYNALGQRVEKDVAGAYTEYVFGKDGNPLGENNRSGWTDTWVILNDRNVAHCQNSETYFMHGNNVGTTAFVTDYTGAVIQDEMHYPRGQKWQMAGTMQEERYASLHHRDSETNLDPTHFRMYSSSQYRWFTPDPLQADIFSPQSMSRYSYAGGNSDRRDRPERPDLHHFGYSVGSIYRGRHCWSWGSLHAGGGYRATRRRSTRTPPDHSHRHLTTVTASWPQLQQLVSANNKSGQSNCLIECIVMKESGLTWDSYDVDANGKPFTYRGTPQQALGLMQVTQIAADQVSEANHPAFPSGSQLYIQLLNPATNIQAGSLYLKWELQQTGGSLTQALNHYGGDSSGSYASDVLNCARDLQAGNVQGAFNASHGR